MKQEKPRADRFEEEGCLNTNKKVSFQFSSSSSL